MSLVRLNFARWPFAPLDARLSEENERWWSDCYLPHPAEAIVESRSQWCVLIGGYQSGKSTALAALRREWQERALVLNNDLLSNPAEKTTSGNILYRILSQASWALRERFSAQPDLFFHLSPTQLEFLRWAIEKFHGHRAFARWLDGLPTEVAQVLRGIDFEDIYPSQTDSRDVQGQIEEMVNLCNRIGYQQILVLVDTKPFPAHDQIQEVYKILGWLEPMQHIGLKLIMALPPIFQKKEILELSRGRVSVVAMESSSDHIWTAVSRYLSAATDKTIQNLKQLCTVHLINRLQKMLADEYSVPPLGAWINLTEILLELAGSGEEKSHIGASAFPEAKRSFFARFMPIHIGPDTTPLGTWRGYKWIPLDRAIYDFLALLIAHKGRTVNYEMVGTTKSNIHTLARRLRVAIEPDQSQTIYLKNVKGEGYWLEKFVA